AGVLLLPLLLVAVQWGREKRLFTRPVLTAAALGLGAFLVLSGALPNPSGYAARLRELFGPASRSWEAYPRTADGTQALFRDLLLSVPRLSSWPMFALALGGLGLAGAGRVRAGEAAPWAQRLATLLPALAALSFTVTFTIGARRTDDRFLLAQAVLLFPYAGVALGWLRARSRRVAWLAAAGAFAASAVGVASVDATLLVDARYEAERYLEGLPAGTVVEVYGGPKFLPRIPEKLAASRVGTDPPESRSHLPHVAEVLDPNMGERRPDIIVLSTEFSHTFGGGAPSPLYGVRAYMDPASFRFFDDLTAERLPYARVSNAECKLPWPLACRRIHGSTGEPVWIYKVRR
ncbi:MAG: hypothetical protein HOO96_37765, partial [Polyangiaceae bacterium]|nr:hypothetical protein [Polyangiaceae bacterium]